MAKTQDFTAMFKDVMGNFPVDTKAMDEFFKTQAAFSEKMSKVALDAAEKSTEISSKWTMSTIEKMQDVAKAKKEPSDYVSSMTEFASTQAEVASEHMAAFAEIAKRVQAETVELMLAAGKDMGEEMQAAGKKAAADMTNVTKKAAK